MSCWYPPLNPRNEVRLTTERIKVLKVIGEQTGQIVEETTLKLDAIKVDHVKTELLEITDHLFPDKVVKQGIVNTQIFYVASDSTVKYISHDIPFSLTFEIPDLKPTIFTEVQNQLLEIIPEYYLKPPALPPEPGIFHLKLIARFLVKVSEWTQLDVVTKVAIFPRVN